MTPELFSDAMNEIGAKYVEEALTYKRPAQRSFWSKLAKRAPRPSSPFGAVYLR